MLVSYEIKLNIVLIVLIKYFRKKYFFRCNKIIFQNEPVKICVTNVKLIPKNMKVLCILHRENIKHVLDCIINGK